MEFAINMLDKRTFDIYNNCTMNSTQTLSISQLRQNVAQSIDDVVEKQEPMIILKRSIPKAILVDIKYFQALEDAVLDMSDSKEAEKSKNESRTPFSSYINKRWGKKVV